MLAAVARQKHDVPASVVGEDAAHARGMSDDAIVDCALESLRHMFGSAVAPPEGSRVTHWDTDPFSCGAYSFAPRECARATFTRCIVHCGELSLLRHRVVSPLTIDAA